jgi:peptidoglycan/LPS O-acetylase OafA/YrhL
MAFFVISGYCIAASAEGCRRKGASFRGFMWRRLHRIYPPYLFAILFFVLTRVVKIMTGGPNDLQRPVLDWVQNLTMTQWVSLVLHPVAEPAQNPKLLVAAFWSLNYEDQFYLVMALALVLAVRWRISMSAVVMGLSVVSFAWICEWPGPWVTGLFIEYWVHFALGALLFYVLCINAGVRARATFVTAVVLLAAWCVYSILPWQDDTVVQQRAFVEAAVACAVTLFLFALRPVSAAWARHPLWKPVAALGTISYSLYLVHQFNLNVVATLVTRLAPGAWQPVKMGAMVALQILIATAFWYVCERPFLNRKATAPGSLRATPAMQLGQPAP